MIKLFFCCAFVWTAAAIQAQDTLILINGIRTVVSVLEIGNTTVKYKKGNNLAGPDYVTSKKDIRKIILKNGTVEQVNGSVLDENIIIDMEMYNKGTQDAKNYYNKPCGAVATGLSAFATGLFGLIPAIAISAKPPAEENLGYPSAELWKNKSYQKGYKNRAKKIKQGKVWGGFGIGIGSLIIVIVMLSQHS